MRAARRRLPVKAQRAEKLPRLPRKVAKRPFERTPRKKARAKSRKRQRSLKNLQRYRRSEEHKSELQSRLHIVCRLLLEKKKQRGHCRDRFLHTPSRTRHLSAMSDSDTFHCWQLYPVARTPVRYRSQLYYSPVKRQSHQQ